MSLQIKKIFIKNFKTYEKLEININSSFNMIIGENNVGKTTLFEALILWKKCYEILISSEGKFYKSEPHYLNFFDLYFLRIANDKDIFYSNGNVELVITLNDGDKSFKLGIEIGKPLTIKNSYFKIFHKKYIAEYERFYDYLKDNKIKTNNAIFIYQTKPISNILPKEPFMNDAQILKKINIGKSHEVLRNKILKCDESTGHSSKGVFLKFSTVISSILNENYVIELSNKSIKKEEYIKLEIKKGEKLIDISLMGSGFLQVLEIFSTLDYLDEIKKGLHIMLIDEPDSHIHAQLQKNLIKELRNINHNQIFIITHNDKLVNETKNNELLFLSKESKNKGILSPIEKFNELNFLKESLGGVKLSLEKLSECKKIIFVEGSDDGKYLKLLIEKYNIVFNKKIDTKDYLFFALRGRGNLTSKIEYTLRFISQLFTDKKIGTIFDKDYSTNAICQKLVQEIKTKIEYNFPNEYFSFVYYHNGYCIESSIFTETEKLSKLITNVIKNGLIKNKTFSKRSYDIAEEYVSEKINQLIKNNYDDIINIHSPLFKDMERKYSTQRDNQRPENTELTFNEYIREVNSINKVSYLMNKDNMERFFDKLIPIVYPYDFELMKVGEIFEKLIESVDKDSWLNEWTEIIENKIII